MTLPASPSPLMQPVESQGQERAFHPIASIFPLLDEEGLISNRLFVELGYGV